jgi:glycosyltransferase involved in cell wall biosynthesis
MTDMPDIVDVLDRAQPLVSIIIPFYRQEAYLGATVESAKRQTHRRIEIIVVDDGSPVSASSVLGVQDGVAIVRTENSGSAAARNRGFAESSGEFLVFLDSDDVLERDAIATQLGELDRHPDAGMSFGALRPIDANGNEMGPAQVCKAKRNYVRTFLTRNPILCPAAVMIRRDVFTKVGGFDKVGFPVEDYLLYLKIVLAFKVVRHTECVVAYRRHSTCATNDMDAMRHGRMAALKWIEPRLSPGQRVYMWCVRAARVALGR